MRAHLTSGPARAATYLCAVCRREATTPVLTARSTPTRAAATAPSRRTLQTSATPLLPSRALPFTHRQASTTTPPSRSISTTSSSSSSSSSSSPSDTPPPSSSIPTYYALFPETLPLGPPPAGKFAIDLRALRREFLRLQAASHPDFHHHAASSPSESSPDSNSSKSKKSTARLRAEAHSALLNTAYRTLCSPLLRAQYLLHTQHGVDLAGDEAGAAGGGGAADAELLMAVLEAREAIEEAQDEADLEEVRRENEGRIEESERLVGEALERGDVRGAVEQAVRLRYWVNIREGVDGWERGKPVVLQH